MHILFIDDDQDDQDIFMEAVKTIDPSITCDVVSSAKEAFEKLLMSASLPRYIFLDINMPVMDGRVCLKELKKNPQLKNIPVIAYSTTKDKEEINVLRYLGASFMHKPTSFHELVQSLSKYLKSGQ